MAATVFRLSACTGDKKPVFVNLGSHPIGGYTSPEDFVASNSFIPMIEQRLKAKKCTPMYVLVRRGTERPLKVSCPLWH